MDVGRVVLMVLAFLGVASLPAAFALLICAGDPLDRMVGWIARWRRQRHERRTIAMLDRMVEADALSRDINVSVLDRHDRRPLEQVAAELRQLRRYRVGRDGRPRPWPGTSIEAYDDRLRTACRCLGITEHLAELTGVDREIERVRVEGELDAAGMTLPAATPDHRQRRP